MQRNAFLIVILFFNLHLFGQNSKLAPSGLMCDLMRVNRDGGVIIYNKTPAFSWLLSSEVTKQSAYQVLVSDNLQLLNQDQGNIWNSGKVSGSKSAGIIFSGSALKPATSYYWKVKVWDGRNIQGRYAEPAVFKTGKIMAEYHNPSYQLEVTGTQPVKFKLRDKIYLADFGKDAFGQMKLELSSDIGGDTVVMRIGELLDVNGAIDRKPPGTIRYAQYTIVLKKGTHVYQPEIFKDGFNTKPAAIKMPEHIGEVTPFRYCEISGYALPLKKSALTRLAVHYPFDEGNSSFHSSDATLNAIWDLCKYSIKATSFLGLYVDGDRERIPYEADAYINQLSHYAVDKEFTIARNTHEYLITHPTWPTEWNLQSVLMAWNDYLYTDDLRSVAHFYPDLQAKTLIGLRDSTGLISTLNGKLTNEVKASIHRGTGNLKDIVDWPLTTETDGFVFTKYNAVVNAFHYRALVIMEKLAAALGRSADEAMYHQQAAEVKLAFQKMFFDAERGIFVDGMGTDHASLHANAFALALGLVDPAQQQKVVGFIESRGMACSVYGSQFLLDGIYDAGDADYGLSLLTSKTDRSWFNMLRVGSTITLEAWDNKYKPNQDWNHAWGAAPANIISRKLMGIEPLSPGWASFTVKPQIGRLTSASIVLPTIKGAIKCSYIQTSRSFDIAIEVPGNTSAEIHLPIKVGKRFEVILDGQHVKTVMHGARALVSNVGSGKHKLSIRSLF
ncbi:MAG: alpha-L-rhamnosidase [Pedobacter sp.]|nr:MAG: alpha-L-rhamnosidase [Pedobacter sp.]